MRVVGEEVAGGHYWGFLAVGTSKDSDSISFSTAIVLRMLNEGSKSKKGSLQGRRCGAACVLVALALGSPLLFLASQGQFRDDFSIGSALATLAPPQLPSFTELEIASGSDKYDRHHYERYYERWLAPYRQKSGASLLEIGAEHGRSLKMWSDYFTDPSLILGLAYGRNSDGVEERSQDLKAVSVYRGDQSSPETMAYLRSRGPFDVIIDDGSHVPDHMVYSFFSLWNSVKPGGIFVVEDLETNYWKPRSNIYGYHLRGTGISAGPENSAVAKFQQFIHILNRRQLGAHDMSLMDGDATICSIEWGMNLVAFHKCTDAEQEAMPPWLKPVYDQQEMDEWLQKAKATNPK